MRSVAIFETRAKFIDWGWICFNAKWRNCQALSKLCENRVKGPKGSKNQLVFELSNIFLLINTLHVAIFFAFFLKKNICIFKS
jgi:hypothetical protein